MTHQSSISILGNDGSALPTLLGVASRNVPTTREKKNATIPEVRANIITWLKFWELSRYSSHWLLELFRCTSPISCRNLVLLKDKPLSETERYKATCQLCTNGELWSCNMRCFSQLKFSRSFCFVHSFIRLRFAKTGSLHSIIRLSFYQNNTRIQGSLNSAMLTTL